MHSHNETICPPLPHIPPRKLTPYFCRSPWEPNHPSTPDRSGFLGITDVILILVRWRQNQCYLIRFLNGFEFLLCFSMWLNALMFLACVCQSMAWAHGSLHEVLLITSSHKEMTLNWGLTLNPISHSLALSCLFSFFPPLKSFPSIVFMSFLTWYPVASCSRVISSLFFFCLKLQSVSKRVTSKHLKLNSPFPLLLQFINPSWKYLGTQCGFYGGYIFLCTPQI